MHQFLDHLQALYPEKPSYLENPWFIAAAVAYSASNAPEAVAGVLEHALKQLKEQGGSAEDQLLLVRKIKDAVFKSGMLSGFPKAINALAALHKAVPEHLRDDKPLRDTSMTVEALNAVGQALFSRTYGETAGTVQPFLTEIFPDMEFFSTTFAYGYAYGFSQVTGPLETSFTMLSALVATDTPTQISWHLQSSLRNGATKEEARAVRQIAIEVAQSVGVSWRNEIPDLE